MWTERVPVGCPEFVREVQAQLGSTAWYREIVADRQAHVLYQRRRTGGFLTGKRPREGPARPPWQTKASRHQIDCVGPTPNRVHARRHGDIC